jgi:hypothetical protein
MKREDKMEKKEKNKGNWTFYNLNPIVGSILSNIFQNSFNSIKRAAPLKMLEPEPESKPFFSRSLPNKP